VKVGDLSSSCRWAHVNDFAMALGRLDDGRPRSVPLGGQLCDALVTRQGTIGIARQ
jgi:hypothetical protein